MTYNPDWGTGGGVTDGDKGDITVSASGTVWSVEQVAAIAAASGEQYFVAVDDTGALTSLPIAVESGEAIYFLEDSADPVIGGYKEMDNPADLASLATVTQGTVADGQLIQAWVTESGNPGVTFIPEGVWQVHLNAFKTGGTKETRIYAEVYTRASGGTETLLGTTANSIALTDTNAVLPRFNIYIAAQTVLATDRIVVKVYMRLIGGGANPTSVSLRYSGTTASRLSLPAQVLSLAGVLLAANNLSDVPSPATARTNLGLGTLATQDGTFSGTSSGTNTGDNAVNSLYSGLVSNANHSGDATGATILTIQPDAVTYAKMQNVTAASRLLGRGDGGAGDVQEITLGTNLSMSGTTLNASGGGGSGLTQPQVMARSLGC